MRVLIVEDEVRLAEALGQSMSEQKYAVDVVYTGTDGLDYALSGLYDVIVLDVMLPGRSGFDIVRELRAHKLSTPVLMLTARDETALGSRDTHRMPAGLLSMTYRCFL